MERIKSGKGASIYLKDGVSFRYCAYVLRISGSGPSKEFASKVNLQGSLRGL